MPQRKVPELERKGFGEADTIISTYANMGSLTAEQAAHLRMSSNGKNLDTIRDEIHRILSTSRNQE